MTKTQLYAHRVNTLRQEMARENIDAYLIPTSDTFQSEYLPPESRHMEWLCGFSGENGMVIITRDKAATFVDGRFTVQITRQAPGDIFEYCHINNYPPAQWLCETLPSGSRVGFDGYLHSAGWAQDYRKRLSDRGITLFDCRENLVNRIWHDRPAGSSHPIILLETAGTHCLEKRQQLAKLLRDRGCDTLLISHPECTNWLLNIRGRDIPCTPVVMSYALLHNDASVELFIDTQKVYENFYQHVGEGVSIYPLNAIDAALAKLSGKIVHIDQQETPDRLYQQVLEVAATLKKGKDPCLLAKARKNSGELAGFRRAHIRDGIAMCQFLAWLEREVSAGHCHNEATLADKIEALRSEQPLYIEPSFETISSLGPNAAICHYNHKYNEPRPLGHDGVYLLDSGGQYLDGTTDVTRTVKVGPVSDEFKKFFTVVLKSHIALASCRFPANKISGLQLDAITRMPLWMHGYDYDHGTGHGVGHCLGVHESPADISPRVKSEPIEAGMIITIEPGYYRAEEWGIRHENQYEVVPIACGGDNQMLGFAHLTYVPFDVRLLEPSLLSTTEIAWLNDYHLQVYQKMAEYLDDKDHTWLRTACQPILGTKSDIT